MTQAFSRRAMMRLAAAGMLAPALARAEDEPTTIFWKHLEPEADGDGTYYDALKEMGGLKVGGNKSPWAIQPPAAMVHTYDDRLIRIPGFVVPLSFDGLGVTEGLLVPYVGACIHVPPPPANQIIFVRLNEPQDVGALWDPVWATGMFGTLAVETELGDAGYVMTDAEVVPYQG